MSEYKNGWYGTISDQFQAIMQRHDMPEDIAVELERFVLETAKEQFRAGSKSGASWLRSQIMGKKSPSFTPQSSLAIV